MSVIKYKTFEEAQKSHWEFNPDRRYYKKLRELFQFFFRLQLSQENPVGIFRYSTLQEAAEQDLAWKVMASSTRYGEEKRKKINS